MRKLKVLIISAFLLFLVSCKGSSTLPDAMEENIDFINAQEANMYFYKSIHNDFVL